MCAPDCVTHTPPPSIRRLVQSLQDCPPAARGEAPPGLLSAAETAHLARLSHPKRRQEWLLGRWTAKRLLADYLQASGETLPLAAITVANDPSGAPYAAVTRAANALQSPASWDGVAPPATRLPLALTISHSRGLAFCALMAGTTPHLPGLGGDLEVIEPRDASFVRDFFTPQEQAAIAAAAPAARDAAITVLWSAKEALLKALHLGLSVDTRQVSVDAGELFRPLDAGWAPLRATLHPELVHVAAQMAGPTATLSLWRCFYSRDARGIATDSARDVPSDVAYVLTLCLIS